MDAQHVLRVIEDCFPSLHVDSVTFLAEGWSSEAWEINGTHVFRFAKRPAVASGLLKEMRLLPVLGPCLPLQTPRFEFAWTGGLCYEGAFVGYRKILGTPLTPELWAGFTGETIPRGECGGSQLALQLGQFLEALHSFPPENALAVGMPHGDGSTWRTRYQDLYRSVREQVFVLLSAEERGAVAERWQDFLENEASFCFAPALIHADLACEHILFDSERGRIVGVIDWEDAVIGDPALDFTGLLAELGIEVVAQVLGAYKLAHDPALVARARFYMALAPFYEVLYGLETGLREHIDAGLRAVRKMWTNNDVRQ